jgi:hypothetical protein
MDPFDLDKNLIGIFDAQGIRQIGRIGRIIRINFFHIKDVPSQK